MLFRSGFSFLFIYFWLCWVFVSVPGPSPAAASGGHSPSRCMGLPPSRPLLPPSTGPRRAGPAVVAHGPSRSAACGVLPDQGSNPRPLHWQADSQPLCHQVSPILQVLTNRWYLCDKCTHPYSIIQNSFTALKIICVLSIHPSLPANPW